MQSTDISKSHASLTGWVTKPYVPAMHLTRSAGLGIQNGRALKVEGTNGQIQDSECMQEKLGHDHIPSSAPIPTVMGTDISKKKNEGR